jgi:MoxR-like ATPase
MEIKGFIKSKKVAQVLNTAHKSGENVVLYGPGGYGKSEMVQAFLRSIGARQEQITVKALSVGTTLDDLLGGINLKTLRETGEISYNVHQSIFSTPYLVLEEAFDAPVRVLEGLKDILTSKQIRNGNQVYNIKTKFIIVATNRSKKELSEDDSSKALMERFPLSLRVYWDSHSLADYQELISKIFGEQNSTFDALISYMLESIEEDESKQPPSPRTAVRGFKVLKSTGIEGLRFLDGLPNIDRAIDNLAEQQRKIQQYENEKNHVFYARDELNALMEEHKAFTDDATLKQVKEFNEDIDEAIWKWEAELNDETLQNELNDVIEQIKNCKIQ